MNLEETISTIKRKPRTIPSGVHNLSKDDVLYVIEKIGSHDYFTEAIFNIGLPYLKKGVFNRNETVAFIKRTIYLWDHKSASKITYSSFNYAIEQMLLMLEDISDIDTLRKDIPIIKIDIHFLKNHKDVKTKKKDAIEQVSKYIDKLTSFGYTEVNKLAKELKKTISGHTQKSANKERTKKLKELDFIDSEVYLLKEVMKEEISIIDKKIFGLIILYSQENLILYLNFQEKEKFRLYETDLWIEGNGILLDYKHRLSIYNIGTEEKNFDDEHFDVFSSFVISTIMSLAVVELKNDMKLKKHFDKSLKVGISFDESDSYPGYYSDYFNDGHKMNAFKKYVKKLTPNFKTQLLLDDLAKKSPQKEAKKLLDQLTRSN